MSITSWLDVSQNNGVIEAVVFKRAGLLMGKHM